jgi:hypothetical protein
LTESEVDDKSSGLPEIDEKAGEPAPDDDDDIVLAPPRRTVTEEAVASYKPVSSRPNSVLGGIPASQLEERLAALTTSALTGDAEAQGIFAADETSSETSSIADTSEPVTPATPPATPPDGLLPSHDGERLARLVAEFGPSTYLPEPERFLAEAQGLCVSEVLIKGRLFITTHRLFFYALCAWSSRSPRRPLTRPQYRT